METGENKEQLIKIEASSFNRDLISKYHLSLQVSLKSFSYALLDTEELSYQFLKNHHITSSSIDDAINKINEICSSENLLESSFSSSSLTFAGFPSILVPEEVYSSESTKEIYKFNHNIESHEKIITDKLNKQSAYNIFSTHQRLYDMSVNLFPDAKIKSLSSILLDQLANIQVEIGKRIYLYKHSDWISIFIFNGEELIFQNKFNCKEKEDVLYYLLFTMEQLKLDPEICPVIVLGEIKKQSETYLLLYDYVRHLKSAKRPHNFIFPDAFNVLEEHQFFGLFTQVLCV